MIQKISNSDACWSITWYLQGLPISLNNLLHFVPRKDTSNLILMIRPEMMITCRKDLLVDEMSLDLKADTYLPKIIPYLTTHMRLRTQFFIFKKDGESDSILGPYSLFLSHWLPKAPPCTLFRLTESHTKWKRVGFPSSICRRGYFLVILQGRSRFKSR